MRGKGFTSNNPIQYTKDEIEKLGQTIIFLSINIPNLYKTKLLKLLFILEEISIKKYGKPFLNLSFEVWKRGPVARDVFIELSDDPVLLKDYIEVETKDNCNKIIPIKDFSDDEFSDNEIKLLEKLVEDYKHSSAEDLINITHRKGSPWYQMALQNNLLKPFENGELNSTEFKVDFVDSLKDNPGLISKYKGYLEYYSQSKILKLQKDL